VFASQLKGWEFDQRPLSEALFAKEGSSQSLKQETNFRLLPVAVTRLIQIL